MTKQEQANEKRLQTIQQLRNLGVKPGKRIYVKSSHVARSGMSRRLHFYIVSSGVIINITDYVARILGRRRHRDGGSIVGGCGMDMGFHEVYNLGRAMFPKGGPLKASNYVRQEQAKRDGKRTEIDGGYLLKHEWL